MPSYRLSLADADEHTVTAECIHHGDVLAAFYDADHELVYAVQAHRLHSIERLDDEDQDTDVPPAEPPTDFAGEPVHSLRPNCRCLIQPADVPPHEADGGPDESNFAIAFGVPGLRITDAMRQGIAEAAAQGGLRAALRQASQYAAESGHPFGPAR